MRLEFLSKNDTVQKVKNQYITNLQQNTRIVAIVKKMSV